MNRIDFTSQPAPRLGRRFEQPKRICAHWNGVVRRGYLRVIVPWFGGPMLLTWNFGARKLALPVPRRYGAPSALDLDSGAMPLDGAVSVSVCGRRTV